MKFLTIYSQKSGKSPKVYLFSLSIQSAFDEALKKSIEKLLWAKKPCCDSHANLSRLPFSVLLGLGQKTSRRRPLQRGTQNPPQRGAHWGHTVHLPKEVIIESPAEIKRACRGPERAASCSLSLLLQYWWIVIQTLTLQNVWTTCCFHEIAKEHESRWRTSLFIVFQMIGVLRMCFSYMHREQWIAAMIHSMCSCSFLNMLHTMAFFLYSAALPEKGFAFQKLPAHISVNYDGEELGLISFTINNTNIICNKPLQHQYNLFIHYILLDINKYGLKQLDEVRDR